MQLLRLQDFGWTAPARSVLHARGQVHAAQVAPPVVRRRARVPHQSDGPVRNRRPVARRRGRGLPLVGPRKKRASQRQDVDGVV
ncbi:unnamed protein product [Ectocarpus sp. 6 AP-2014]